VPWWLFPAAASALDRHIIHIDTADTARYTTPQELLVKKALVSLYSSLWQHPHTKTGAHPAMTSPLLDLPSELVAAIFAHLCRDDLYELNLTSRTCRTLAAPLIWKHVDLIDCRAHTSPVTGHRTVTYGAGTATHSGRSIPLGASPGGDEHDDTPLIKKLWILAT
jgi:hypothetical protein